MFFESIGIGVIMSKEVVKKMGVVKDVNDEEKFDGKVGEGIILKVERKFFVVGKCLKCGGDLVICYNRKIGKRFVGCFNWLKCDVIYLIF